jgi:hypothetical protein
MRHSEIKGKAIYDGAFKYDIYGRPAIGRSGGGLFNDSGELIGVCNAAAVESDEGIYSAIDSLHWQLKHSSLDHLFTVPHTIEPSADHGGERMADASHSDQPGMVDINAATHLERRESGSTSGAARGLIDRRTRNSQNVQPGFPVSKSLGEDSNQEVIIIVRSKSDPRIRESITIDNPTNQLLDYLSQMKTEREPAQVSATEPSSAFKR